MKIIIIIKSIIFICLTTYGQTNNEFFKFPNENIIIENGNNINKGEFFIVSTSESTNDKDFLDKCQVYIEQTHSQIGTYLTEDYYFYKESLLLNKDIDIETSELLSNHMNDLIAILRYSNTRNNGLEKRFILIENGNSTRYYVNGVEKPRIR